MMQVARQWVLCGLPGQLDAARWRRLRLLGALAGLVLAAMASVAGGLPEALLVGLLAGSSLLGWLAPRWLLAAGVRRLEHRTRREMPALVDRLSVALGCGLGWSAALRIAGHTRHGVAICRWLLERRSPLPAPLAPLARQIRTAVGAAVPAEEAAIALRCLQDWSRLRGRDIFSLPGYSLDRDEEHWRSLGFLSNDGGQERSPELRQPWPARFRADRRGVARGLWR